MDTILCSWRERFSSLWCWKTLTSSLPIEKVCISQLKIPEKCSRSCDQPIDLDFPILVREIDGEIIDGARAALKERIKEVRWFYIDKGFRHGLIIFKWLPLKTSIDEKNHSTQFMIYQIKILYAIFNLHVRTSFAVKIDWTSRVLCSGSFRMFFFTYYFGSGDDELYKYCKAYYVEIERDWQHFDANRFLVSNFLKSKLEGYSRVQYIQGLVWKADNNVIKMYWDRSEFEHAVKMQHLVVSCGMGSGKNQDCLTQRLGCKLLDTWINEKNGEYFTVSEYGGKPLNELYEEDYAMDLLDKIGE